MSEVLLEAKGLTKHFPITEGIIFSKQIGAVKAVDDIDFSVNRGETFGLVGESGCGKTTTLKLILMLEKITKGSIRFENIDISGLKKSEIKRYRAKIQTVFQDPYSSLNPRMKVSSILAEPMVVNLDLSRQERDDRIAEVLELVGLRPDQANLYPHEFSGGQRQRIAVARALTINPEMIVLDEPVSALDVSIKAQIMNLLKNLQKKLNLSYFLIAHDLAVVKHMSDEIGVMYLGKLVEKAESGELHRNPLHPYTQALYSAALPSHPDHQREEIILSGEVPSPINPPKGCRFNPRCDQARPECKNVEPILKDMGGNHLVACHLY